MNQNAVHVEENESVDETVQIQKKMMKRIHPNK